MQVNGTNLTMIRGDNATIFIRCETADGFGRPFEGGDTVRMTVKRLLSDTQSAAVIRKTITEFSDGVAVVEILPAETKALQPAAYIYDVELTEPDGRVTTIIRPSGFTVEGDVTNVKR